MDSVYTLYTDKPTIFECKIELDGASLKETMARLVVELSDRNLMFIGTVNSDGICSIPVSKLRGIVGETVQGNISLEVIAEDTYFKPWSSKLSVETTKKMTVEVASTLVKPAVRVNIIPTKNSPKVEPTTVVESTKPKTLTSKIALAILAELKKAGVTKDNAPKFTHVILSTIQEHAKKSQYKGDLISEVVSLLSK